jgi:UDP-N-acetylmuramoyl-tripeptide--D-alanyl-D-alanine ligase
VLKNAKSGRRIAVLGDVLEMGKFAETELYKIGENMECIDALITVGKNAHFLAKGAEKSETGVIESFDTLDDAISFLDKFLKDGDNVLVKASRGMHFEKIVEALEER